MNHSDPKTEPPEVVLIDPDYSPSREELDGYLRIDATL